ncbi:copper resistance protein CopC, partial [Deinococcus sp. GbtcB9]|uniref:copper resistance protein CopC n=1 Tax=Deinococcus sp. GbtcB9 TaxID=2824754 RepID=UPI0034CDCC04
MIAWKILSEDGHPVAGSSTFRVRCAQPSLRSGVIPCSPSSTEALPVRWSGVQSGTLRVT